MAISAPSQLPTEASVEPELGSDEQRMHLLADVLAMKLRLGYEIESETDFAAVVFSPGRAGGWGCARARTTSASRSRSTKTAQPTSNGTKSEPLDSRCAASLVRSGPAASPCVCTTGRTAPHRSQVAGSRARTAAGRVTGSRSSVDVLGPTGSPVLAGASSVRVFPVDW